LHESVSQAPARSAAGIAAATPADRDRWVDTLRVGSLLVVILGHWLMVVLTDDLQVTNALVIVPSLQPLTWVLQVMPLFFLVGGVAHAHTLESLDRRWPPARGGMPCSSTAAPCASCAPPSRSSPCGSFSGSRPTCRA
jgi:hypothetical protein